MNLESTAEQHGQRLITVEGITDFWERVRSAKRRALILDYDGTLAPFNEDRHQAFPLKGIPEALEEIERTPRTDLAVISGRPVAEIQRFLGRKSIPIAGTHGFEFFHPDLPSEVWELDEDAQKALDQAEEVSRDIIGEDRTERKVATVALHVRGLPHDEAERAVQEFEARLSQLADLANFEIRRFDGGVELRALGRDKGTAIRDLAVHLSEPDLMVYIGDDDTDEDAFRALPPYGLGIKVGPPERPTAAQGRLSSCSEVRQFLWNWIQIERSESTTPEVE